MPSVSSLLRSGSAALRAAGLPDAEIDSALLLQHVLSVPAAWTVAHGASEVDARTARRFASRIASRIERIPLAYLTGATVFAGLPLRVTPAVLIPRPETEDLLEHVFRRVRRAPRSVVDVGTGSGAIALALARAFPDADIHAVDASAPALRVARSNARALALPVRFHRGDLLARLPGPWDLVVANLPYLTHRELTALQPEVAREPRLALDGGSDGSVIIRRLLRTLPSHLAPGGLAALEIHPKTAPALRRYAHTTLADMRIWTECDLAHREHFLFIERAEA